MKAALAILVSFVLIQSEAFALRLQYPVSLIINGAYSGVMLPDANDPATDQNALGLFTFNIPQVGLSSGTFFMFANGTTFNGTINAFTDTNQSTIQGVMQATYPYSLTNTDALGNVTTTNVVASAVGQFNSKIITSTGLFNTGFNTISGTAILNIDYGQINPDGTPVIVSVMSLTVSGIQQHLSITGA